MNNPQIFDYKGKPVRTIERDDGVWWVLKDVCDSLGLSRSLDAAKRLDEDEVGKIHLVDARVKRIAIRSAEEDAFEIHIATIPVKEALA